MTRKEAIKILKKWKLRASKPTNKSLGWVEGWVHREDVEAFDMALSSLETDESYQLGYKNKCIKMREPTPEELETINKAIKNMSYDTGALLSMEQNRCRICYKPISKGMFCFDCRQYFSKPIEHPQGMSSEDTKMLADLIDKYGISMMLMMIGTIEADKENKE